MRGTRVVALGDSVTSGLGDSVPPGYVPGWAGHLAVLLGGPPAQVLAERGARVRDVVADQLPEALRIDGDIATLLVGGNDILRLDFGVQSVADGMRDMCRALQSRYEVVVVVLLHDPATTLPLWLPDLSAVMSWRARRLNAALIDVLAPLESVLVVDPSAHDEIAHRHLWHSDRMHPSPAGHRLLAQLVAERLAERGHPVRRSMPPTVRVEPSRLDEVWWAARTGVPWVARRAFNLIPEMAAVVLTERREALAALRR